MDTMLSHVFDLHRKVAVGMVHLLPLPGAPRYGGSMAAVRAATVRDAQTLAEGGIDGIMIENFGDVPFYPGRVPAETVAAMTELAGEVRRVVGKVPIGINVLRNDGLSAIAVAAAVGAKFVRINVLCGARLADQGILQGIAHDVLRLRKALGAEVGGSNGGIAILADVDVKHSAALAERRLEDEVEDTVERALADGLVVSGAGTGKATDAGKVKRVKAAAGMCPVFIGSGATVATLKDFWEGADGFIVGTSLKAEGKVENVVEVGRVRELMRAVRGE